MIKEKILVCGRGYSSNYYNYSERSYTSLYGYNQDAKNADFDWYFYSKSKEDSVTISHNVITESYVNDKYNLTSLMVGTTTFGLYQLLSFIEKNHPAAQVDLVGFDFRYIYEEAVDLSRLDVQAYTNIESQKIFSSRLKHLVSGIDIKIVGFDEYSDIDPKTGDPINKSAGNVEIVAEITTNHFGDTDRLIELITSAHLAGADSVKLQMRDVASFYTKEKLESKYVSPFGATFQDYRLGLELSDEQLVLVDKLCCELGIGYFFSVLDRKSFERVMTLRPTRIKLPSTISNKTDFIDYVFKSFKKEIVVSTGMTNQDFVDHVQHISSKTEKLYLLHCISSYPVNIFHSNLKIIDNYANMAPNIIPGYSSHDIGFMGSMCAVFSGARMIEKHIKLGNSDFAHFDETALDVNLEFPDFVEKIRAAELIYGEGEKVILDCEHHKY